MVTCNGLMRKDYLEKFWKCVCWEKKKNKKKKKRKTLNFVDERIANLNERIINNMNG